jgi:hypothetical protein
MVFLPFNPPRRLVVSMLLYVNRSVRRRTSLYLGVFTPHYFWIITIYVLGFNKSFKSVTRVNMELLKKDSMVSQYIALFYSFGIENVNICRKLD